MFVIFNISSNIRAFVAILILLIPQFMDLKAKNGNGKDLKNDNL